MALMNCPECNKVMSDTIKKCPHCGFVIKKKKVEKEKVAKEKNNKLKDKILNLLKNKKFWIGFLIFVIVVFVIFLILSTIQINRVNKAVRYLEDEDYKCEKIDSEYQWYNYVCNLVKEGALYEYLLSYDQSFWERVLGPDYFSVSFTYTDDEYFFRVSSDAAIFLESYPGDNSLSDSVNDAGEIIYVVKGKKLEYDKCKSYSRDSYFYNYDDERKCEKLNAHYEKYEKIIEDVIDEREDLYDEVGKELVWRER